METPWKELTRRFLKRLTRSSDEKSQLSMEPHEKLNGYIDDLTVKFADLTSFLSAVPPAQSSAFSPTLYEHDAILTAVEQSTWELLRDMKQQQQQQQALTSDQTIDRLRLVIKWVERYFTKTCKDAQAAIRLVEESRSKIFATAPSPLSQDPDARFKGMSVDKASAEADEKLLSSCWALLKAGRRDMVNDLCVAAGQEWRAASFFGAKTAEPLWRMTCFVLSKKEELSLVEKAIYGLFSGNYAAVAPLCTTWEERLWAATHILLDYIVRRSNANSNNDDIAKFFGMLPDGDVLRREFEGVPFADLKSLLEKIDGIDTQGKFVNDVMYDVKYLFNKLQESLILRVRGEVPFAILDSPLIVEALKRPEVLEFNSFQLPRFFVHYINYFASGRIEMPLFVADINVGLLKTLITGLIRPLFSRDFESLAFFIPYYSSFVYTSKKDKIRFFAERIIEVFNEIYSNTESEKALKRLNDFKMDIVEKNGHGKFSLDKVRVTQKISEILFEEKSDFVGSVKWLTLFMAMRLQLLTQANNSIQEVMSSMSYVTDNDLFISATGDTPTMFDNRENMLKIKKLCEIVASVADDTTHLVSVCVQPEAYPFAVNMIYEFECHKLCVKALASFSAWEEALGKADLGATDRAAEEFEFNALSALRYENGIYSYPYCLPTYADAQSKISSLKLKLIPNLFYRLLHVYSYTYNVRKDKQQVYFDKARDLVRLASSEQFMCYKYFTKPQLLKFVKAFNSFKIGFLSSPCYAVKQVDDDSSNDIDI